MAAAGCNGLGEMHYDLYQTAPICVDNTNGSDTNEGRGWDAAVKTITQAVSLVGDGGEIWVKKNYQNTSAETISKSNIGIYGGFGGTESRREERDVANGTTVTSTVTTANNISISANITNVIIDGLAFSGISNSSYNIINLGTDTGVSLQNCSFTGNTAAHQIYSSLQSTLTLENSVFAKNTGNGSGGAVYIGGNAFIQETTFSGNTTTGSGGALYAATGTVVIKKSVFSGNCSNGGSGGAVYISSGKTEIYDSKITANYASQSTTGTTATTSAGGGLYSSYGTITIENTTMTENVAVASNTSSAIVYAYGGGIYNTYGTITVNASTVSDNYTSATTNSNSPYSYGGGMYSANGIIKINNTPVSLNYSYCSLVNTAYHAFSYGGGIYSESSTLTVNNSEISSNAVLFSSAVVTAHGSGAGILALNGTVSISNSTIKSNSTTFSYAYGGGIYANAVALTLSKSFLSSNNAKSYGAGLWVTNTGSSFIDNCTFNSNLAGSPIYVESATSSVTITNSIFSNNTASSGSGAILSNGILSIYNSLFYNNSASIRELSNNAGSSLSLRSCTLVNTGTGAMASFSGTTNICNSIFYTNGSMSGSPTVTNSYSNITFLTFTRLTALSDEFAGFSNGDFRLANTSQLINAGNNAYAYGDYDLDNTARIKGGIVDIGCYEKK